jgi:hypothetical protein
VNPRTASAATQSDQRSESTHRARVNFAVFAVVTAGLGWLYVLPDKLTGAPVGTGSATNAGGTAGQGLWIVVPVLAALLLYLALPQAATDQGRVRDGQGCEVSRLVARAFPRPRPSRRPWPRCAPRPRSSRSCPARPH